MKGGPDFFICYLGERYSLTFYYRRSRFPLQAPRKAEAFRCNRGWPPSALFHRNKNQYPCRKRTGYLTGIISYRGNLYAMSKAVQRQAGRRRITPKIPRLRSGSIRLNDFVSPPLADHKIKVSLIKTHTFPSVKLLLPCASLAG